MAAIGHEAFLNDSHTNLKKYLADKSGETPDESGIRDWLKVPERCHVIKTTHNDTGELMGFICWAHRGFIPRKPQPEATKGRISDLTGDNKQARTKVQIMEDMEDKHFVEFMTDIMPE